MNFVGECPPDHDGLTACPGGIHELYWPGGYLYLWCLILLVTGVALVSFVMLGIIKIPRCSSRKSAAGYATKSGGGEHAHKSLRRRSRSTSG